MSPPPRSRLTGGATTGSGARARSRLLLVSSGALAFGVAFGLVCYNLSLPHGLYGVAQYDDGVYLATTLHFVNGSLPYRDFVFLQPPGIAIVLSPLGLLAGPLGAREAMALARVLTGLVAGANAVMVVYLLRRRGVVAASGGGLALALFPPAYAADHTLMLEPYLVFFCLLATVLAFSGELVAGRRRVLLAGLAFGFAGAVKTWAVVVVAAAVIALALSARDRIVPLLAGVVLGFAVPCAVFFIAAPHAFLHDVVVSQLGRQTPRPTPLYTRLAAITGIAYADRGLPLGPDSIWPKVASVSLFSVLVGFSLLPSLRRGARVFERYLLLAGLATVAAMLLPVQFFDHYAYFCAPFLALILGCALGRAGGLAAAAIARLRLAGALPVAGGVLALVVLAGTAVSLSSESSYEAAFTNRFGDPGPRLEAAIAKGACVVSDASSILVSANRLDTAANCPAMVDATGTWLSYDPDHPPVRSGVGPKDPALVALWQKLFASADYATFAGRRAFRVPFTASLRRYFAANYKAVPGVAFTYVHERHT